MYTLERYHVRPKDGGASPPGSLGVWPTGFSGGGWLVRDTAGAIVFADAFRVACLNYASGQ